MVYTLSFQWTGGQAGTGSCPDHPLQVLRVALGSDEFEFNAEDYGWQVVEMDFTANAWSTPLYLYSPSFQYGDSHPFLDAVSVIRRNLCPADLDASGAVNGVDLAIILNTWGTAGGKYPQADIDRDGVVGGTDLALILGAWGECQ
jgi:hypothetical protein